MGNLMRKRPKWALMLLTISETADIWPLLAENVRRWNSQFRKEHVLVVLHPAERIHSTPAGFFQNCRFVQTASYPRCEFNPSPPVEKC
jgi:hypothetical protein